ncbi:hypothetical protein FRB94_000774 [Tulasnella sp. JGI-2019a]|nr:hypothetical protein FRB93_002675 [Tulasnella sp. JGI-2019a]KAG9013794.1 hypothetical protein FRB94_000774 [Tulasnella sp. JGI-2019a]KAG9038823.1 hypothetical protein FRB95_014372 [Tulasnella sp. JGI-2019a]
MATSIPSRGLYASLRRHAHENPTIFWSCVLGAIGPVMAIAIPPIRQSWGWTRPEKVPTSYPVPKRARNPPAGYEDP